MIEGAGSSQVPAYGLGGALLAAVALLAIGGWLWVASRRDRAVTVWTTVSGLVGLGVAFAAMFVEGMRHYGGATAGSDGSFQNCDVWWQEAGLPSSRRALEGDLSPNCRHDAIAAILPGVLTSVVLGLLVAVVLFALMLTAGRRRRRRGPRAPRDVGRIVE